MSDSKDRGLIVIGANDAEVTYNAAQHIPQV